MLSPVLVIHECGSIDRHSIRLTACYRQRISVVRVADVRARPRHTIQKSFFFVVQCLSLSRYRSLSAVCPPPCKGCHRPHMPRARTCAHMGTRGLIVPPGMRALPLRLEPRPPHPRARTKTQARAWNEPDICTSGTLHLVTNRSAGHRQHAVDAKTLDQNAPISAVVLQPWFRTSLTVPFAQLLPSSFARQLWPSSSDIHDAHDNHMQRHTLCVKTMYSSIVVVARGLGHS